MPALLCGIHLPGNRQCEFAPMYAVSWDGPNGRFMTRHACDYHLAQAVREALIRPMVTVTLL